jgi:uncharacterized protein YccT (UPF0319 family)|tara:strand:- start:3237 stop:3536 length:300 start_codon:yes stop_codon:yes gene_type:complete
MRELNEQEKKAVQKAIQVGDDKLKNLNNDLEYATITNEHQQQVWKYEDNVREYNRNAKSSQMAKLIESVELQIEVETKSLAELNKQLNEGVEDLKEEAE